MGVPQGEKQRIPSPLCTAEARLFTVGHSSHELGRLVQLLQGSGITAVADVRSAPYSQRLPHFSRPQLREGLQQYGIEYIFLGEQLGGRPTEPELYDATGRVDYERVRATAVFQQGLDRVCAALDRCRVALLCAEEDPLDCHRGLMIAPALAERGFAPAHVRGSGRVETAVEFEERLLAVTGVGAGFLDGLFAATLTAEERAQLLVEAYRSQARRKAFRLRPGDTPALCGRLEEEPPRTP